MRNVFSAIIISLLVLAGLFAVVNYYQLKQEKAEITSITQRIQVVKKQTQDSQQDLSRLQESNQMLQEKIQQAKLQIDGYSNQISSVKKEKVQVLTRLQDKRLELSNLNTEMQELVKMKGALKGRLDEMSQKRQETNYEIIKLSDGKRQLEEKLKKYITPEKGVELDKIIVKLSKAPEGPVLVINSQYGFAIIGVGAQDGIIVGDILGVYRDNKLISKVVVDNAFEDMSSAVPAEGFTNVELATSDKVSLVK